MIKDAMMSEMNVSDSQTDFRRSLHLASFSQPGIYLVTGSARHSSKSVPALLLVACEGALLFRQQDAQPPISWECGGLCF